MLKTAIGIKIPVYVQFYVTARCNFRCQQCNIIHANSDLKECSIDTVERIADNLANIGVPIILLTGGEPFLRNDLPDIVHAFESRNIHVRMQTNGYAKEEQIEAVIEKGGKDISVSLDSLNPDKQDKINGNIRNSWHQAVKAMACFTKYLPRQNSFASIGCVLQRDNLDEIENIIRFGSAIGWFTSLVPVHVTDPLHPMNFRSLSKELTFKETDYPRVREVLENVRLMKKKGFLLYDSDTYLDDIYRFICNEPTTWRNRNKGICDSPELYFVILPNGEFAPCCDFRTSPSAAASSPDFPGLLRSRDFKQQIHRTTERCSGCMFGSFPEITLTFRNMPAMLQRIKVFLADPPRKPWPMTYGQIKEIAHNTALEQRTF